MGVRDRGLPIPHSQVPTPPLAPDNNPAKQNREGVHGVFNEFNVNSACYILVKFIPFALVVGGKKHFFQAVADGG